MPEGHQKEDFTLAGIAFTFPRVFDKESYGFMRFSAVMASTLQRKCARTIPLDERTHERIGMK